MIPKMHARLSVDVPADATSTQRAELARALENIRDLADAYVATIRQLGTEAHVSTGLLIEEDT